MGVEDGSNRGDGGSTGITQSIIRATMRLKMYNT